MSANTWHLLMFANICLTFFPMLNGRSGPPCSAGSECGYLFKCIHGEVSAVYFSSRNVQLLRPPRNVFEYKSHPPLPSCGKTVLQPLGTLTARTAGERARDIGSDCKSRAAARAGAQTPTRARIGVRGEHPRSERAPSRPERVHPSLERALRVFPRPLKLKGAFSQ